MTSSTSVCFRLHPANSAVATRTSANFVTSVASVASIHALASRHSPQPTYPGSDEYTLCTARPSRSFIRNSTRALLQSTVQQQTCPLPPLNHSSEMSKNIFKFGVQSCRCLPQSQIPQPNVPSNMKFVLSMLTI
jgi:hypothetical protein